LRCPASLSSCGSLHAPECQRLSRAVRVEVRQTSLPQRPLENRPNWAGTARVIAIECPEIFECHRPRTSLSGDSRSSRPESFCWRRSRQPGHLPRLRPPRRINLAKIDAVRGELEIAFTQPRPRPEEMAALSENRDSGEKAQAHKNACPQSERINTRTPPIWPRPRDFSEATNLKDCADWLFCSTMRVKKGLVSLRRQIWSTPSEPRGSVVFVHGLSGGPFETWQSSVAASLLSPSSVFVSYNGISLSGAHCRGAIVVFFGHIRPRMVQESTGKVRRSGCIHGCGRSRRHTE
jgi:hypothetical protein